ncbi:SRPBCC domain-containing protein [Oculatella sp. LEGE 06141]|uniref:SRPBCC domain-containing protein n=1 Tax=Oculatella sp. LEGE 06141 TaxID=1828648 RepID=UPI00188179BA|nr:SRPBCC domain-containing protein [Oculatella sp. LEGE 06141]MBE9177706.1 SRPBCC domain-containing protein [Oculatella sp. LEGE 06141]
MPSLYTEIEINAPKTAVWQALIRKQDWLKWNTFLYDRDATKAFVQGKTVFLSLRRLAEEAETEFEPMVTLLQPETCLVWVYSAPGFRSEHVFELQDVGRQRTKYIHRETFSGTVSRLFLVFLRQDEQQGLRRMARELKRHVEDARPGW